MAKFIEPVQAEGLIFCLALGFVLPSVATVLHNDPFTTWAWQFYSGFMALARVVYVLFRTPHTNGENTAKETVKPHRQNAIHNFYIAYFLIVSIAHILFV